MKPIPRLCLHCGTEFFERRPDERCPRCSRRTVRAKPLNGPAGRHPNDAQPSRHSTKGADSSKEYSIYVSNSGYLERKSSNDITDALDQIVLNAKNRIWIAVPWFYTTENPWINSFIEKLCNASKKGIDVKAFLRPDITNHTTVNQLTLAGAKVFSKKSIIRYIHTKMALNESEVLTVTANITDTDLFRNLNSGTLTNQVEFLNSAIKDFEKLLEPEIEEKQYSSDTPIGEIVPPDLLPFFEGKYTHLNPMQAESSPLILQHRENLLVGAEAGTGKTLLAELAAFRELHENPKGKVLYTAPLKAITIEKEQDWNRVQKFGYKVYKITGDEETVDIEKAKDAQLILSTGEKWDSLTRKPDRFPFVKELSLAVVDEIHILDDEDRGATVEALLSRIKRFNPKARILGLSATMTNIENLAQWLNAESYLNTKYRSVPIHYAFCAYPMTTYISQMEIAKDKIVLDTVQMLLKEETETGKPGKILIFTGSRVKAENTAKMIGETLDCVGESYRRNVRNKKLDQCLSRGTAFLHAGLALPDRRQVLSAFNHGDINVLAATTALAWGVNLAARSVIVRDIFIANRKEVDIIGIKQMLGRAGRKGKETVGYGIILVPSNLKDQVQQMLIEGKDIESKLERHILDHMNAEIKLGYVKNDKELRDWFLSTYWYYQKRDTKTNWKQFLDERLSMLVSNGFVEGRNGLLKATPLGRLTADWYVKVNTAIGLLGHTKDFDYHKQGSAERIELLLMRILAENAEELSMFIRSPEEKEEITAFQTQNPMLADCGSEAAKICMIMSSAIQRSGHLTGDEYQAYKESIRLMGYMSELGRIKDNISLMVIGRDLAKRLQFHEERGAGQLLNLIWWSTPDNDFKDRTIEAIYEELRRKEIRDMTSLLAATSQSDFKPVSGVLWTNATRFPSIDILGLDGKHVGEDVKLLIKPFGEPANLMCRTADSKGEYQKNLDGWVEPYVSLSELNKELTRHVGLKRVALELFSSNRFGWDYQQVMLEILVLPSSWRREALQELEDYLKDLETEIRTYSFLKELWLKIKRRINYVEFGAGFVEASQEARKIAQILTRDAGTNDQNISNIIYFIRRAVEIIDVNRLCPPVANLLKGRKASYDEVAIITASLFRCLGIESGLVEVRGGITERHYLPTYVLESDMFVVDYFNEISEMNARIRLKGDRRIKIRNLRYLEDQRNDHASFAFKWLQQYLAPENRGERETIRLRNYDDSDLDELKKYSSPYTPSLRRLSRKGKVPAKRRLEEPPEPCAQFVKEPKASLSVTVVEAKYHGRCALCGGLIEPEDQITWWRPDSGETRWVHVKCPSGR